LLPPPQNTIFSIRKKKGQNRTNILKQSDPEGMSNREIDALIHFEEFEISQLQSAAVSKKIHLEIRMFVSSTFGLHT
jgi:hypothetical protein